jgi:integrase
MEQLRQAFAGNRNRRASTFVALHLRPRGAGWTIRLHEKGGKHHLMPCHHALADALHAYIDAAGIAEDHKGFLFRTSPRHNATMLTDRPLTQANAWLMIRRRAKAAGIAARIGCHSFQSHP